MEAAAGVLVSASFAHFEAWAAREGHALDATMRAGAELVFQWLAVEHVSVRGAARSLGLSRRQVLNLIARGRLWAVDAGGARGAWRIPRTEIDRRLRQAGQSGH